jgi:hypothetical protein
MMDQVLVVASQAISSYHSKEIGTAPLASCEIGHRLFRGDYADQL